MLIKNIVFDFGGVLIDWNPVYLYDKVFTDKEKMKFFLDHICSSGWNIQQDAGRPLAEATKLLQAKHPEYENEIALFYGRWEEMLGGLLEENVKLIKPLKEKYKIYGLTKGQYDFFNDLDGIVVSGEEKLIKPDPKLYRILLDRYGIAAEESLFIDDNRNNIVTAQSLNFNVIHFSEGVNLEETLKTMAVL